MSLPIDVMADMIDQAPQPRTFETIKRVALADCADTILGDGASNELRFTIAFSDGFQVGVELGRRALQFAAGAERKERR